MKTLALAATLLAAMSGLASSTTTANSFGTLRVDSTLTRTIVAVPWIATGLEDDNIKVKDVVKVDNLKNGDTLSYYNSSGKFETWKLSDGQWVAATSVTEEGVEVTPSNAEKTLPRGGALVLIRQDTSKPFYLYGQAASTTPTTTIAGGSSTSPVYTLVAPPVAQEDDININTVATWTNVGADDRIYLPGANGLQTQCKWAEGQWKALTYTTQTRAGVQTKIYSWTTPPTIPAGTGFWYVSKGEAAQITWNVN